MQPSVDHRPEIVFVNALGHGLVKAVALWSQLLRRSPDESLDHTPRSVLVLEVLERRQLETDRLDERAHGAATCWMRTPFRRAYLNKSALTGVVPCGV